MNKIKLQILFISLLLVLMAFSQINAADILSGRVYEGNKGTEPPTSTAMSGVSVKLYASNNSGNWGLLIDSTYTDSQGWYGLTATVGYEYYTIIETVPSGYHSVGATSTDGTVISDIQIRYSTASAPLSDQTLTGNKFWIKPDAPPNNPPVADANGPYTGKTGQSITLDGSGSYDPDSGDSIVNYEWDIDYDGQYDDASGVTAQYTWYSAHNGYIGLRVTDSHGATDTDSTIVTITEDEQDASVGDRVWHDLDQDGLQDTGEPDLDSVQVSLFDQNGNLIATTMTNFSGLYMFTNVAPGSYFLRFSLRSGFTFSPPDQGMDDTIDSDAQSGTGDTPIFALNAGDYISHMDAGMYQSESAGEIRGAKWNDLNGNGIRETGEPGLANWQIILDYNQDGTLDPSTDWIVTTSATGDYKFAGFFNGLYFIGEILQSGWLRHSRIRRTLLILAMSGLTIRPLYSARVKSYKILILVISKKMWKMNTTLAMHRIHLIQRYWPIMAHAMS